MRRSILRVQRILGGKIGQFYQVHYLHASARLDLPTFQDAAVQQQILNHEEPAEFPSHRIVWRSIRKILDAGLKNLTLISQLVVLIRVIGGQRDGFLLAILCIVYSAISLFIHRPSSAFPLSKPHSFGH